MSETVIGTVDAIAKTLKFDITGAELAQLSIENGYTQDQLDAINGVFTYLKEKKDKSVVDTLLKLSRLPLTEPKTFDNFDFSRIHGKDVGALKNLSSLAEVHARQNIALIGPPGTGKTHISKAVGRECCIHGMKAYFLKATELNEKLTNARKTGKEEAVIRSLVKPTCLIIDEVGRCVFSMENTRMFFDLVDRRYGKECPNTMIFTSNMTPDKWPQFFQEESSLLCAVDRIFDNARVFMIRGESYRGRKRETLAVEVGGASHKAS